MSIPVRTLTLLMAGAMLAGLTVAADAQSRRSGYGVVTAESRYGPATITAPVRNGPQGRLEVRLPGGTWIECRRSCSNTLRQETVDFWYIRSNIDPSGNDGPGYITLRFGW